MEIDIVTLLAKSPELVFFLVLGLGYMLGNIRFRGFQFGPTAGVLLAGLAFGHFGFTGPIAFKDLGFILFIYSVGYRAGPRFFAAFRVDGLRYLVLCLFIVGSSVGLAVFLGRSFDMRPSQRAGLLAGALTSTPTLVAAQDAVRSGMVPLSDGENSESIVVDIAISYAITYVFGMLGLIALVRLLPALLRINLEKESERFTQERRLPIDEDSGYKRSGWSPVVRAYEVTLDVMTGKTLRDVEFRQRTHCVIPLVKRGTETFSPTSETVLQKGDRISVFGFPDHHRGVAKLLGEEIADRDLLEIPVENVSLTITSPRATGKRLSELNIDDRYGCIITKVSRSAVDLPLNTDLVIENGDTLQLTGLRNRIDELADKFGHVERDVQETDLLTFAFGIALGLFMGAISIKVGNLSLGISTAGGLLFSGILVGWLRSLHPNFGRVPPAVRWIFMELGLMLLMAGIGLNAGKGLMEAIRNAGPQLIISGAVVTTVPVLVGFLVGRFILRMNLSLLLGALTGAMTSTPALNFVSSAAKSSVPGLGYSGTYAFANIMLAVAGTLLMLL